MLRDINLETARLVIRPFTMDDLQVLHAILSQETVMEYLPEDVPSLEEVEQILDFVTDCYTRNTPKDIIKFTVAVVDKATGRLIGWVGLGPLEFDADRIELYYGLAETYWGRGLATEAGWLMLDFGFRSLALPEIVAVVDPENKASVRVLEKLGMKYLRVVRNLPPDQRFYTGFLYYSLSREEFGSQSRSGESFHRG
jgi:ribosomal-protein-alanine N-acetyltransferase